MHTTSQKNESKYRGSTYALSMFILYPNYTHRIPIGSPGLMFGGVYVWKDLWDSLQVNLYSVNLFSGGLIFWDLTVCQLSSI